MLDRPSWDEYFMSIAMLVATRSPDSQWKAGAVIVNENKHIISTGYNGFPPGLDDEKIPNVRPKKYAWVLHSEANALLHAEQSVKGCTIYTNGQPCLECLKKCLVAGIRNFVITNGKANMVKEYTYEQRVYDTIVKDSGISIKKIDLNKNTIQRAIEIYEISK